MLPQTTLLLAAVAAVMARRGRCFAAASSSSAPSSPRRNVGALSDWAKEQGVTMHDSMQWKSYGGDKNENDDDEGGGGGNNWGLELREPVEPGTVLLRVPRHLSLESDVIRDEMMRGVDGGAERLHRALEALGDFCGPHEEGFLIFCKLFQCRNDPDNHAQWTPWINAMPQTFASFSSAERECLPFYARYVADYQDQKFQAFCRAASVLFGEENDGDEQLQRMKWAFDAVGSRFWKNSHNSELVPIGDMFNHREPPNVFFTHDDDSICFVYRGNKSDDCNSKDLFISYGQPSNPHRFLGIFGFVPTDMPEVWSHISYPDNPFSDQVSKMTFRTADGLVPKIVWDAVLYALQHDPGDNVGQPTPSYTTEEHAKHRELTASVLQTHVSNHLEELAQLRSKIETTQGENMDLIRTHNEFLTKVFSRVKAYLEKGEAVVEDPADASTATQT